LAIVLVAQRISAARLNDFAFATARKTLKPAFPGRPAILLGEFDDSGIIVGRLRSIDRGGHAEPGG
jgi:hypothetical protein